MGFLLPGSEVSLIFAALLVQKGLTPYTGIADHGDLD
jgi:hypothetical protein